MEDVTRVELRVGRGARRLWRQGSLTNGRPGGNEPIPERVPEVRERYQPAWRLILGSPAS
jgi:hypothetical protein